MTGVEVSLRREFAGAPSPDRLRLIQQMAMEMTAAYSKVSESREENFEMWQLVMRKWDRAVRSLHEPYGYGDAPMFEDRLWLRVSPPYPSPRPDEHIAFMRAMMVPYTRRFQEHLVYRFDHGGNWVVEITGATGRGKSSLAMGLANWFRPVRPERLLELMVFDLAGLPDRYGSAGEGETVIVDEAIALAGQGSRILSELVQTMEETTRQSRINLIFCSPTKRDHAGSQCELEVVLVNWDQKAARCIAWVDGFPMGYVSLPFAPDHLWAVYTPWKAENVGRSKGGSFRDKRAAFRRINRLADQPDFRMFVGKLVKPKKQDLEHAVSASWGQLMGTAELATTVNLLWLVANNWDRWEPDFARWVGEPASEGLRELAKRCYKE